MGIQLKRLEGVASRPLFAWAVAIALGIVNMLPNRFAMNPDGITYMNLAIQYQNGDWAQAINGYWSPLYPLLIAATFQIVHPSAYLESTIIHALTFVIYLGAFATFRFFLRELRASQNSAAGDDENSVLAFRSLAGSACAYSLFFWAALSLIGFPVVTPDMMIALLLFAAAGLTIRLRRTGSTRGYLGLGAIIGLAYLTKSVMFPLGVVACLFCAVPAPFAAASRRSALAFAGFLLIASPQLVTMSRLAGHLSYSSTGELAYARAVNRTSIFWVGMQPGSGTPVHGMGILSRNPAAFDLSFPNTTFSNPISDQMAYWLDGIQAHVSIAQQLRVTKGIVFWYVELFEVLIVAALILYLLRKRLTPRYVALIVPALAAFGIYALIYVESRYIGAAAVILFLSFAASLEFDARSSRGLQAVMVALALFYGMSSLNLTRSEVMNEVALVKQQFPNPEYQAAVEAERLGLKRGDRVGTIGYAFKSYWARLAGVQIAMQAPNDTAYSSAPDSARANVIRAFRDAGAAAVVSIGKPMVGAGENWQKLGPRDYWILLLGPRPN